MKILVKISHITGINWYIALTAAVLALAFTFVVFPAIADSNHVVLDPDSHGPLGFGIWKLRVFSYYPSADPASARGPLYPTLIAGSLALTAGWWPYSIQLTQCILFGLLCLLAFSIAETLWCRPLAVLAAGLCAIHPFLIWYTSRVWIETLMMLLFTALIGSIVHLRQQPTPWSALLVGLIVGLSVLAKSIYTPFLILTPLLLLLPAGKGIRPTLALLVFISGILVVAPWTIRNGRLTGTYAPVVGGGGFTLHQGNDFVQDFHVAPFSVSGLFPLSISRMKEEDVTVPLSSSAQARQNALDAAHGRIAVQQLIASPTFLLKKIAYNSLFFWTLGDTASKSTLIAALQLPLVAMFVASLVSAWRRTSRSAIWTCAALIGLFYGAHLPTLAIARYSVVLVPSMLIIAVGIFQPYFADKPASTRSIH